MASKTSTTKKTRTPKLSREEYLAQRSAKMTALAERLERWRESDSERQQERYEERFAHYSERNQELLLMQAEELGIDATVVKTFKGWVAEGRVVIRGQHGMTLLKPAGSKTDTAASKDQERAAEASDPTGTQAEKIRKFFKPFTVFDISQTVELAAGVTPVEQDDEAA